MRKSSQPGYIWGNATQRQGLLGRVLAFVIGLGVLAVSIFVGAVFLAALIGLLLIGGLTVMMRIWWVKRRMAQYRREHGDIEGVYQVVERDQDRKQ